MAEQPGIAYAPPPRHIGKAVALLLLFVLIVVVVFFPARAVIAGMQLSKSGEIFFENVLSFTDSEGFQHILHPIDWYNSFYQKQMDIATGKTQWGVVERNVEGNLGVTVRPPRAHSPQYAAGEEVSIFSTIEAKSLSGEMFTVAIDCRTRKGVPAKSIEPSDTLQIQGERSEEVVCVFDPLEPGAHVVEMKTQFGFVSFADLVVFATKKSEVDATRQSGKNFFQMYAPKFNAKISSISTKGPVNFGMGFTDQPLILDEENPDKQYYLLITLNNAKKGVIKKAQELVLIVPKGFSLQKMSGVSNENAKAKVELKNCEWLRGTHGETCDAGIEKVYRIGLSGQEIKDYKNMHAVFTLDNAAQLLGQAPYIQRTIKALFAYEYAFEETTSVYVREDENEEGQDTQS